MSIDKKIEDIRIRIKSIEELNKIYDQDIEKAKSKYDVEKALSIKEEKYRQNMQYLAWIFYFEDEFGDDIKNLIPDLTQEEIAVVDYLKQLFVQLQSEPILERSVSGIRVAKKVIEKIKRKINNEKYVSKNTYYLGDLTDFDMLIVYFSEFTEEEKGYLKKGYKMYLDDKYEKTLKSDIRYLKNIEIFRPIGNSIIEAGKEINKSLTETGHKIGNEIRELDDIVTPAVGKIFIFAGEKLKESAYEDVIKAWRKNIYKECMEDVPLKFKAFIPEELLERKFKEFMEELIFFSDEVYFKIESYEEQLKKEYLQEKGEECPEYILRTTLQNKFGEEYYGTYCKFEAESKETVELCRNAIEYYKSKYR